MESLPLEISPADFRALKAQGADFYVVDVRTSQEYDEEHIPGAILIPYQDMVSGIEGIAKDRHIITYCSFGSRSKIACHLLRAAGYTRAQTLQGGLHALNEVDK